MKAHDYGVDLNFWKHIFFLGISFLFPSKQLSL